MFNNFQIPEGLLDDLTPEQIQNILGDPKNLEFIKQEMQNYENMNKSLKSQQYLEISQKELEKLMDKEGGLQIEPQPSFVYKTFYNNGEKLFINICEHHIIDQPEEKELVDFGEDHQGIRIPMSVGQLKEDHDKSNNICRVVDVVLNPKVVANIKNNEEMKQFLQELLVNYLNEKYKIEIRANFKMIKLKYKGKTVNCQRIKAKKAPKIETISSEPAVPKQEIVQNHSKTMVPDFSVYLELKDGSREEFDGEYDIEEVKYLVISVHLPLLSTANKSLLQVNKMSLLFNTAKIYELCLNFPFLVDSSTMEAVFENESKRLEIRSKPLVEEKEEKEEEKEKKQVLNIDYQIENDDLYNIY